MERYEGKHFQKKRCCTVTRGGGDAGGGGERALGNGFICMEISMKGKVFTKSGWGFWGFLGDRFIYMERYEGIFFIEKVVYCYNRGVPWQWVDWHGNLYEHNFQKRGCTVTSRLVFAAGFIRIWLFSYKGKGYRKSGTTTNKRGVILVRASVKSK